MSQIVCNDDQRRRDTRAKQRLFGLDYLEVGGADKTTQSDQTQLRVCFLGDAPPEFDPKKNPQPERHLRIEGGRRIRNLEIESVRLDPDKRRDRDQWLTVKLKHDPRKGSGVGDFSTYTLRLAEVANVDPRYDHVDFTFKVDCPSELDCAIEPSCLPESREEPVINYLAKDYASFRQLILDRLALALPEWRERHVPDLGIALVEILAYVGDYLSYYQDAVATESYLDTARRRISVRRHARLVDYFMHEGGNARAWLALEVEDTVELDAADFYFVTNLRGALRDPKPWLPEHELREVPEGAYLVFEPRVLPKSKRLEQLLNEIPLYTWLEKDCCLPRGATSATLVNPYSNHDPKKPFPLQAGDFLLLEEIQGPKTGIESDADPGHRHVVRLTRVLPYVHPKTGEPLAEPYIDSKSQAQDLRWYEDPLTNEPRQRLIEIEWAVEDALPFPLCLSSQTDAAHGCLELPSVSIARGNILLIDHGKTITSEPLGAVPVAQDEQDCECGGRTTEIRSIAGRFAPTLEKLNLTYSAPLPSAVAANVLDQNQRPTLPQLTLQSINAESGSVKTAWESLDGLSELVDDFDKVGLNRSNFPDGIWLAPRESKWLQEYREKLDSRLAAEQDIQINELARDAAKIQYGRDEEAAKQEYAKDLRKQQRQLKYVEDQFQANQNKLEQEIVVWNSTLADQAPKITELSHLLTQALSSRVGEWQAVYDLLNSPADANHFVVEIDNDRRAHLRFGDGELGRQLEAGTHFYATYRVGNGTRGNVGAEKISHFISRRTHLSGITRVRNPLSARGGTDPETLADVKQFAPYTFRRALERAINARDYAALTEREFASQIQRAAASLTWTGSWYEADIALDPRGTDEPTPGLQAEVNARLQKYRRMGHDLRVHPTHYVPLDVQIEVCVQEHYLKGHVKQAVGEVFSAQRLPNGKPGFFHPDNYTFGDGVYLSQLVAAAQAVEGVESVTVTRLKRYGEPERSELSQGGLRLTPLQLARLDRDPSFPENGVLDVIVRGGR